MAFSIFNKGWLHCRAIVLHCIHSISICLWSLVTAECLVSTIPSSNSCHLLLSQSKCFRLQKKINNRIKWNAVEMAALGQLHCFLSEKKLYNSNLYFLNTSHHARITGHKWATPEQTNVCCSTRKIQSFYFSFYWGQPNISYHQLKGVQSAKIVNMSFKVHNINSVLTMLNITLIWNKISETGWDYHTTWPSMTSNSRSFLLICRKVAET